jgi:hypothetical protein
MTIRSAVTVRHLPFEWSGLRVQTDSTDAQNPLCPETVIVYFQKEVLSRHCAQEEVLTAGACHTDGAVHLLR